MKKRTEIRTFRPSRWWSNVQALRIDAGLTEQELSGLIGKSEGYLKTAIKNGGVPNLADAVTIAELFDTTCENLAFGSIGLEIRKAQLETELQKIIEEIEDAKKDVGGMKK